ncbi:MAG: tetratricopeptide repeat protein, partial [Gammaproteobacteria bacterium]|nr:tetratricopeptide repeat protein [Gammaproteobacteria bacterium]
MFNLFLNRYYAKLDQPLDSVIHFKKAAELLSDTDPAMMQIATLNELALAQLDAGRLDEAINVSQRAIKLAGNNDHPILESTAWTTLGQVYSNLYSFDKAAVAFQHAIEMADIANVTREKVIAGFGLTGVYKQQGNYYAADDMLKTLLKLVGSERPLQQLALINLGQLHTELGDYNQAINYFRQNLSIAETDPDRSVIIDALLKLGNVYFDGGFYTNAIHQYQLALDQSKINKHLSQQVTTMANLAWANRAVGNISLAKTYADQSVQLSSQVSDSWVKAESLHALAQLQIYTRDSGAIDTAETLYELSKNTDDFPINTAMEILGSAYEQAGNYAKAIELYQQALSLVRDQSDRPMEGSTLDTIGTAYQNFGDHKEAESAFR